jgi:hypothetical protein
MSDRAKVIVLVVVLLAGALFPVWRMFGETRETTRPPELELPKNASDCVEATDYMIGNHMDLLNRWRDAVVREGEKEYTSSSFGKTYVMSLTGTCLECHTDSEKFCNRCHDYADVQPTCWNCHVETRGS